MVGQEYEEAKLAGSAAMCATVVNPSRSGDEGHSEGQRHRE